MLPAFRDGESPEKDEEHEKVVDAERHLDGVSGDELQGQFAAFLNRDPSRKRRGKDGQGGGPDPGKPVAVLCVARLPMQKRIDHQQDHYRHVKAYPPRPRRAANHASMLQERASMGS